MLWPVSVDYLSQADGWVAAHHQSQGNVALFVIVFLMCCIEALVVKMATAVPAAVPPQSSPAPAQQGPPEVEVKVTRDAIPGAPTAFGGVEARLQTGEWLYRQVQLRLSSRAVTEASDSPRRSENGHVMEDADTAQVREFIEKLVENLVEGELDNVNVSRLYDHPEYDRMFSRYHALLCDTLARLAFSLRTAITNKALQNVESPSVVHAQLKQLVKRVVREATALPRLKQAMEKRIPNGQCVPQDIDTKTYEDILATAILNKVIEKYQRYTASPGDLHGVDGNRNVLGVASAQPSGRHKRSADKRRKLEDDSDDETSTHEDGNWSEESFTEPVSLVVEECIEQVTTYNSEDEREHAASSELDFYLSGLNFLQRHRVPFPELGVDIVDGEGSEGSGSDAGDGPDGASHPTDLLSPVDSWEENWLFQKRRLKCGSNVNQPVPVPMLVPNPSEGYRALIGDRDAEEVSDLSECSEDAMEDLLSDLGSIGDSHNFTFLADGRPGAEETAEGQASKGGQGVTLEARAPDDSSFRTVTPDGGYGGSAEEYASIQDGGSEVAEATNAQLFKSASVDCLSEFGQQDSEYTEDYAMVTRRQMSSLTATDEPEPEAKPVPRPRNVGTLTKSKPEGDSSKLNEESGIPQVDPVLAMPPRPGIDQSDDCMLVLSGTIAEREHRKWETAPPLANNPYSSENISKRLQKRPHRDSRSSSDASLDFPNLPSEGKPVVTGPLKVRTGAEPDSKKYGRDYYVNSGGSGGEARVKAESQQKHPGKEDVPPSQGRDLACPVDNGSRSGSAEPSKEADASQLKQAYHVGSEVVRWQKGINHNEKQWIHNLQNGSPEPLKRSLSASVLTTAAATYNTPKPSLPRVADLSKRFETPQKGVGNCVHSSKGRPPIPKCPKAQPRKQSNVSIISRNFGGGEPAAVGSKTRKPGASPTLHKDMEPRVTITCYPRPPCVTTEAAVNGNGRHWDTDSVRSEESTVSSIDSEYSPCLPSVKELAKQFSGGTESDSSASLSNSLHRLSMTDLCSPNKDVVIVPREHQQKTSTQRDADTRQLSVPSRPLRQVHSLTARSMSREFREGLRRNLPVALDRNVHSFGGSEWSLSGRDHRSRDEYDTTPGYTSDESGTVSPVPAPGTLRNSIAFWESIKQSQ